MTPRTLALLGGLTLSAGYADAVAFFGLGTFTANMTGNTVLLGAAIVRALVPRFGTSVSLGLPTLSIVSFTAGAACAALVYRGAQTRRRAVLLALAAAMLIVAAVIYRFPAGAEAAPCIVLLSAVMGLQSVVAVRSGVAGISTVYVTGTLITAIVDTFGLPRTRERSEEGAVNWTAWLLYLAGAIGGAFGLDALGDRALWPPAIAVLLLLTIAW
jgi:uncharacterized membrane protein YoaK (UPF0700 family)